MVGVDGEKERVRELIDDDDDDNEVRKDYKFL